MSVCSRNVEALNSGQQRPLSLHRRGSKSYAKLSTEAEAVFVTDCPLVGYLGVNTERLMTLKSRFTLEVAVKSEKFTGSMLASVSVPGEPENQNRPCPLSL